MENASNRFVKAERLNSKKLIKEIFEQGTVLYLHPLKIFYRPNDCPYSRILITVPKRLHKRAVARNLIKRRIREAYRLSKGPGPFVDIAIVYISSEILEFKQISNKINNVLAKIKKNAAATEEPAIPESSGMDTVPPVPSAD